MILYTDNTRNLESLIINRSKQLVCDEICILSAYVGVGPILKISEIEGVKVDILYGSTQTLPGADGRVAAGLLKFVGFKEK